ncbi:MAG: prepilin-type N-terminal cleavage/methylation domain-containing protein [Opitutaceae bacterium]|nr:prepilin-type N-terminal cleavage/methylation domain-containing protein [Opitutaceae bacterium]
MAFTLVELLTVVAIIGILLAIIIPTAAAARNSAKRVRTRIQFAQWATAIENFRQEYGYYPIFDSSNLVNARSPNPNAAGLHVFHDTLVGRRRDGSALPHNGGGDSVAESSPETQNPRLIPFIAFTEADLFPDTPADECALSRNLLHDAFGNTQIAVLVDKNLDGVIKIDRAGCDYTTDQLPAVYPPDNTDLALKPSTSGIEPDILETGVRAGVIFYSAPPGVFSSDGLIKSWK